MKQVLAVIIKFMRRAEIDAVFTLMLYNYFVSV